jgi:hypothetical protein
MIRLGIGFLLVMGAVGGMDNDPSASLLLLTGIAILGLGLMHSGIHSIKDLK